LTIQHHQAAQTGRGLTQQLCGYETAGLDVAEVGAYPARLAEVTPAEVADVAAEHLTVEASMEIRMDPRTPVDSRGAAR
jgi:predicted Zn-dependent peptidase